MKNKKNKGIVLITLALTAVLAVGGTLAYLSSQTEELDNEFSFIDSDGDDGDMQVDIDEPEWDEEKAKEIVPGDVIDKDPVAINSSSVDIEEWVAMTVEIVRNDTGNPLTDAEKEWFLKYVTIDFDTNGETPGTEGNDTWTKLDSTEKYTGIYYYNTKVESLDPAGIESRDNQTVPLFTNVSYSLEADNAVADKLKNEWEGFTIKVKAYAVQGPHITYAELPAIWADVIQ